jgi:hypothetical protein
MLATIKVIQCNKFRPYRNPCDVFGSASRLFLEILKHGTGVTQHGQVQILNTVRLKTKHGEFEFKHKQVHLKTFEHVKVQIEHGHVYLKPSVFKLNMARFEF